MGALRSSEVGSPPVVTMAPLDGSGECFSLDSPRSIEACRRQGLEDGDLKERSEQSFFQEQPQYGRNHPSKSRSPAARRVQSIEGHGRGDATAVIRKERHEINRHRLLREVDHPRRPILADPARSLLDTHVEGLYSVFELSIRAICILMQSAS